MDPQDRSIKKAPNELGNILLDNIEINDDHKIWLASHFDKDSDIYQQHFDLIEKKFDEMRNEYTFNHVYADYSFDYMYEGGEVDMRGGIQFVIPLKKFIIDTNKIDWEMKRKICKDIELSCNNFEISNSYNDKDKIEFNFDLDKYELGVDRGNDYIEEWNDFLKSVKDIDDDYDKHQHDLYSSLIDLGIIDQSVNSEDEEDILSTKFNYFEIDDDEYDKKGNLFFESKMLDLASFDDILKLNKSLDNKNIAKKIKDFDVTPIVNIFENIIRKKSLSQLKHHRSQGVLPGFSKPSKPEGYIDNKKIPKVAIKISSELNNDIYIDVKLVYNIHTHDKDTVRAAFKKVMLLDNNFPELVHEARKIFLQSFKDS